MRKCVLFGGVALILSLFAVSPAAADSCSAVKNCPDGSTQSCSGTSSCILGSNYDQCDGVNYTCPSIGTTCSASHECRNSAYVVFCSGTGPCSTNISGQSVTCGSTTRTCAGCEAGLYRCLQRQITCGEISPCTSHSQCPGGSCTSWGSCICP